ncbi:MAG: hypothetical protein IT303_18380 [Dehalococcoidia bacterium]|nr:hypothetical protein [Dehalococcoidia bacterium]
MNVSRRFPPGAVFLVIMATGVAAILVGLVAGGLSSSADEPSPPSGPVITRTEDAPLPQFRNPFINMEGRFFVHQWDDRVISEEAKRADPWLNPAWEPFAGCLAGRGLEVRHDPSQPFDQDDLDTLLDRLNRAYPDPAANLRIPQRAGDSVPGDAGAFLACAEEWLTKSPQEIYELTGVPSRWWPPEPTPRR